jgi:hypothetical protein
MDREHPSGKMSAADAEAMERALGAAADEIEADYVRRGLMSIDEQGVARLTLAGRRFARANRTRDAE